MMIDVSSSTATTTTAGDDQRRHHDGSSRTRRSVALDAIRCSVSPDDRDGDALACGRRRPRCASRSPTLTGSVACVVAQPRRELHQAAVAHDGDDAAAVAERRRPPAPRRGSALRAASSAGPGSGRAGSTAAVTSEPLDQERRDHRQPARPRARGRCDRLDQRVAEGAVEREHAEDRPRRGEPPEHARGRGGVRGEHRAAGPLRLRLRRARQPEGARPCPAPRACVP